MPRLEDQLQLSAANLLPLLIPHAVVNHDITRHISAQQWVGLMAQFPDDCDGQCDGSDGAEFDDDEGSVVENGAHDSSSFELQRTRSFQAHHAICIPKSWGHRPFGHARFAALSNTVALNDSHAVLQSMADLDELRLFFAGRPYTATLNEIEDSIHRYRNEEAPKNANRMSSDNAYVNSSASLWDCRGDSSTDGDTIQLVPLFPACLMSSATVHGALRWLRQCAHRRPIDLPRYDAETLVIVKTDSGPRVPFSDIARLVAHSVATVQLRDSDIDGAFDIDDLELLPRLSTLHCSRGIARVVRKALSKDRRESLRARITATSPCLVSVFPHLTRMRTSYDDTQDVSVWRDVASRAGCLRALHCDFVTPETRDISEHIISAFSDVGPTLSTLELTSFRDSPTILKTILLCCETLDTLTLSFTLFTPTPVFSVFEAASAVFKALRVFDVSHINCDGFAFDEDDRRTIEALPAALPLVEKLTLLSVPITQTFVDAVAKLSVLEEWHSDYHVAIPGGDEFTRNTFAPTSSMPVSGAFFPRLRTASLACGYAMRAAAHAPQLRILSVKAANNVDKAEAELSLASTFSGMMFRSPFVRFIDLTKDGSSASTLGALGATNVWGLTVRIRGPDVDTENTDDDDEASPPSHSAEAESISGMRSFRSLTLLLVPSTPLHRVTSLIDATRRGERRLDACSETKQKEQQVVDSEEVQDPVNVLCLLRPVNHCDTMSVICDGRGMPELPPIAAMGESREMLDAAEVCNAVIARDGDTTRCFEGGWA